MDILVTEAVPPEDKSGIILWRVKYRARVVKETKRKYLIRKRGFLSRFRRKVWIPKFGHYKGQLTRCIPIKSKGDKWIQLSPGG